MTDVARLRSRRAPAPSPWFVAGGAALGLACSPNGAPCAAPSCGAGYECIANTCAPAGADPVPKDTTRIVVEPASVASIDGGETNGGGVELGRDSTAALYLRFDPAWKRHGAVARAFLLVEPKPDAPQRQDDLLVEVWTVHAPWSPERIAAGHRPNLGLPRARGIVRSSPPATARIDVTKIVSMLSEHPSDHGVALLAAARLDDGVGIETGTAGGAPVLELYVRPARSAREPR